MALRAGTELDVLCGPASVLQVLVDRIWLWGYFNEIPILSAEGGGGAIP